MQTNVALWFPLAFELIETVEVTCGVVKEDALRSQALKHLGRFELRDCLQEPALLISIDNMK